VLLPLAVTTASAAATAGGAANYLVYVDPHPPGVDCQKYQLGILAAALGGYVRVSQLTRAMIFEWNLAITIQEKWLTNFVVVLFWSGWMK
jgi:hypothetical protein